MWPRSELSFPTLFDDFNISIFFVRESIVKPNRREFLKTSAAAAGVSLLGASTRTFAQETAWSTGMQINSAIDNLRVVCVDDPTMLDGVTVKWDAASQNQYVVRDRVQANMDAMAQSLVSATNPGATADQAWQLILRKPAAKQWSEVNVAFKVNCLEPNLCTKFAVIEKLCLVLNGWGVPFTNMYIYDRITNAYPSYGNFVGAGKQLPAGIVVCNPELGAKASVTIAGFGSGHDCAGMIANGSIDILVNCPSNKGHDDAEDHGRCTLSMKNNYGTCFTANQHQGFPYTVAMNQSDYILGGTPVRQQLVFCESLYAMSGGPNGVPDQTLNRLIMGVFGPAVDYLIATKIRAGVMGVAYTSAEQAIFTSYLTNFGYAASQFSSLNLISVTPAPATGIAASRLNNGENTRRISLLVQGSNYRPVRADLLLPMNSQGYRVAILDAAGRTVRELGSVVPSGSAHSTLVWDCTGSSGKIVASGHYLVQVASEGARKVATLVLMQ